MKKLFLTLAISLLVFGVTNAQDDADDFHTIGISIPEVAIIDIESTNASTHFNLVATAPTEAGLGLDFTGATNNKLWLNYTSIVPTSNAADQRTITAQITAGTIPTGLDLAVTASTTTTGVGTVGASNGIQILDDVTAKTVINGIGSCYTEDGANKGSNLAYVLSMKSGTDIGDLVVASENLTITYTISE